MEKDFDYISDEKEMKIIEMLTPKHLEYTMKLKKIPRKNRTVGWLKQLSAIAAMIAIVFFIFYLLTQYVSLGSILSSLAFGIGFVVFHHDNIPVMLGGIFMSALTTFQHRGNIVRLLKGQERKTNLLAKGKK